MLPGTERVVCLDEADGKILWTHEYDCPYTTAGDYAIGPRVTPTVGGGRGVPLQATFGMAIAPPVAEGNSIFIMSYSRKSWCLRVAEDGLSAEVAWQGNTRRGIDGAMNRPFIQDGRIYGCGHNGRFLCARLDDGEWLWNTCQPSTGERPAVCTATW